MSDAASSAARLICSKSARTGWPASSESSPSSLCPNTVVSRLLKSCAIPPASWPMASIFWACWSCSSSSARSVWSRRVSTTPPTDGSWSRLVMTASIFRQSPSTPSIRQRVVALCPGRLSRSVTARSTSTRWSGSTSSPTSRPRSRLGSPAQRASAEGEAKRIRRPSSAIRITSEVWRTRAAIRASASCWAFSARRRAFWRITTDWRTRSRMVMQSVIRTIGPTPLLCSLTASWKARMPTASTATHGRGLW